MNEKKKELISSFIDGELDADDTRTAEFLITSDLEIRKMYQEIKSVDTIIETLPEITPSSELRIKLIKELDALKLKYNKEHKLRKTLAISTRFAIASSILLLVTLAVFIFANKFSKTEISNIDKKNLVNETKETPDVIAADEIKPDEEMFEHMDLLRSFYNFEDLASLDESIITQLENNADLALVESALNRSYYNYDNFSNE